MGPHSQTLGHAYIIADSLNAVTGDRITTVILPRFPKVLLQELNTHRVFCLSGDSELEFELPVKSARGARRVYKMTLREFADKWHNGATPRSNKKKREFNLSRLRPEESYTVRELVSALDAPNYYHNLNTACRAGRVLATKEKPNSPWRILGSDFIDSRAESVNRQPIRDRLKKMRIRQLNERTKEIQLSTIADCYISGQKEVFNVAAGEFSVKGTKDHRVLTTGGWKVIGDLVPGQDYLVVRKYGKPLECHRDSLRNKKVGDRWVSTWNNQQRKRLIPSYKGCQKCGSSDSLEIHHIHPVHQRPDLAFSESNIELLCHDCHNHLHRKQGWQEGVSMYTASVPVKSVTYFGIEDTYDLEIVGEFPNFLANGVVVHNSRNAASSRAIPVEKMIRKTLDDPYIPKFTKSQKGMSGIEDGDADFQAKCEDAWVFAMTDAIHGVRKLLELDCHKQNANRLLEPFVRVPVIITSTKWENFFNLRCHPAAHPDFREVAIAIRQAREESEPVTLGVGQWHIPMFTDEMEDFSHNERKVIATARCARVSYNNHDGSKSDYQKDLTLYKRLESNGHLSPFEHCAIAVDSHFQVNCRNFSGFYSHRALMEDAQKEP